VTSAAPGIDLDRLATWVGNTGIDLQGRLTATPLGSGKSNLTATIRDARGEAVVLRRPPLGPLLPTAHDVVREARIIGALGPSAVPVPAVLGTCEDEAVIGAPFVVFELVDGLVLRDAATAGLVSAACRERAGFGLVDALHAVHATDVHAVGLGDLARPGNYVERQLHRWQRQWEATADGSVPLMDEVHARLVAAPPEQQRTSLVHSDPKLDNCVLGDDGELRALVDWELATVGDPLADLGLMLAYWAEPSDETVALQDPPTRVPGFATRDELVARYAARSDLDLGPLDRYLAFSYWKVGCIVQGVLSRRRANPGVDPADLEPFERQVPRLAAMAASALGGNTGG
jgi:aminoglycoside phosphotransferase (APT) family kinase protein